MARSKITIVGAGNVGATCAHWLAAKEVADLVLIDIAGDPPGNVAKGKALDLMESYPVAKLDVNTSGGADYALTEGSDVVVITAGVPRKKKPDGTFPSRDELVKTNQAIVADVTKQVVQYSPNAVLIIVSNPLDAMCHVALHESGFPSTRVVGMAGALDTARYKAFIAMELGVSVRDVHGLVLGGHGDEMVPLPRHTSVAGIPIRELISEERLQAIIERTRKGGGEIVGLIGVSAWYAPGGAAAEMAESIVRDQKRVIPSAVYLTGQYGYDGLYIGVPAVLGKNGVEKVIEMQLNDEEKAMLEKSASAVRSVVGVLGY